MSRAFEWQKAKTTLKLEGDDWPQCLTIPHIAELHFPDNKKYADVLQAMLEKAVDDGDIIFNEVSITSPSLPVVGKAIMSDMFGKSEPSIDYSRYRPEITFPDWITLLAQIAVGVSIEVRINNAPFWLTLTSRFHNGWPKSWHLQHQYHPALERYNFLAMPLISNLVYAAWCNKPELPADSPLKYWLDVTVKTRDIQVSKQMQDRLDNIRLFIKKLETTARARDVKFDAMRLPMTKEQMLNELKSRYKDFNIGDDAFNPIWSAATKAGICGNCGASSKKGKDFLKSIFG